MSSKRYIGPVALSSSAMLKAIAVAAGSADSPVASADFTISSSSAGTPAVLRPSFSPGAGSYASPQLVTLRGGTPGSTIYYTLNGATPTRSSSKYVEPVPVASTETLKAFAVAPDGTSSTTASATYSIATSSVPAVINFANGFADAPTTIEAIGGAHYSGSTLQLTSLMEGSASNAYFTAPVNVQAFNTTFSWTATCPSVSSHIGCGDGMGFTIVSTTNPNSPDFWSGDSGGDLAWASECTVTGTCEPLKSVLVKFDLYNNQTGSPGANLTGYYTGGEYPQAPHPQYDMAPAGINIQSGHLMRATLLYDGATLYETVTDTVNNATYTNRYTTNIPALVGGNSAIVGFTGGMGRLKSNRIYVAGLIAPASRLL